MWMEDILDLAKIVYKKNEKFDPDKSIFR